MIIKTNKDEIQSYLLDTSNLQEGFADAVVFPTTAAEVIDILTEAARTHTPVTASGAGTGTVGGRVPFGGIIMSTEKLNRIGDIIINKDDEENITGGQATAGAGVILGDFQRAVESLNLFYPPDPTERNCFLGATVSTNSSGARTFKYGPTRDYIERVQIALTSGDLLNIRRGEIFASGDGSITVPVSKGKTIKARLPDYQMPATRKHAAGYFVKPGMDLVDLFIGSEGTLGLITEVETKLLPKPKGVMSGVVFFRHEAALLSFARDARENSLKTRAAVISSPDKIDAQNIDARSLEYLDGNSLRMLRQKYTTIPEDAAGAIFFEQETNEQTEDTLMNAWLELLEKHDAPLEDAWFATNETDRLKIREFRHHLPVMVNEWLTRTGGRKISTDMAVPDGVFPEVLRFYRETLTPTGIDFIIFGHIGDNHVHVNILPKNENETEKAREIYLSFVDHIIEVGGTVSAEHGIGKLKVDYLRALFGDEHIGQMAALKRAFDPACILGRGNMFAEKFLSV